MSVAYLYTNPAELDALRTLDEVFNAPGTAILCSDFTPDMTAQYTHVIACDTPDNNAVLARIGALLGIQPITQIARIIDPHHIVRPLYGGQIMATVRLEATPALLSVSLGLPASGGKNLHDARVVVGGGKGMGSAGNFALIKELADTLGGAYGASLDAIQAGWAATDLQIGQTGVHIAPDLYIACGISGAAHHVGGIRRAKTVLAINTNPHAPIFHHADYGYVGDAVQILPELIKRFKS